MPDVTFPVIQLRFLQFIVNLQADCQLLESPMSHSSMLLTFHTLKYVGPSGPDYSVIPVL